MIFNAKHITVKIISLAVCLCFLWQDIVWAGGETLLRQVQLRQQAPAGGIKAEAAGSNWKEIAKQLNTQDYAEYRRQHPEVAPPLVLFGGTASGTIIGSFTKNPNVTSKAISFSERMVTPRLLSGMYGDVTMIVPSMDSGMPAIQSRKSNPEALPPGDLMAAIISGSGWAQEYIEEVERWMENEGFPKRLRHVSEFALREEFNSWVMPPPPQPGERIRRDGRKFQPSFEGKRIPSYILAHLEDYLTGYILHHLSIHRLSKHKHMPALREEIKDFLEFGQDFEGIDGKDMTGRLEMFVNSYHPDYIFPLTLKLELSPLLCYTIDPERHPPEDKIYEKLSEMLSAGGYPIGPEELYRVVEILSRTDLQNHRVGDLFITALPLLMGGYTPQNWQRAIDKYCEIMKNPYKITLASFDVSDIGVIYEDGSVAITEGVIDDQTDFPIRDLFFTTESGQRPAVAERAGAALSDTKRIGLFGPGTWTASLRTCLFSEDMLEKLRRLEYFGVVMNTSPEWDDTGGRHSGIFTPESYLDQMIDAVGGGVIDFVIVGRIDETHHQVIHQIASAERMDQLAKGQRQFDPLREAFFKNQEDITRFTNYAARKGIEVFVADVTYTNSRYEPQVLWQEIMPQVEQYLVRNSERIKGKEHKPAPIPNVVSLPSIMRVLAELENAFRSIPFESKVETQGLDIRRDTVISHLLEMHKFPRYVSPRHIGFLTKIAITTEDSEQEDITLDASGRVLQIKQNIHWDEKALVDFWKAIGRAVYSFGLNDGQKAEFEKLAKAHRPEFPEAQYPELFAYMYARALAVTDEYRAALGIQNKIGLKDFAPFSLLMNEIVFSYYIPKIKELCKGNPKETAVAAAAGEFPSPEESGVRAVFFDLGNVIFRWDYRPVARALAQYCNVPEEKRDEAAEIIYNALTSAKSADDPMVLFESGKILPFEYFKRLKDMLSEEGLTLDIKYSVFADIFISADLYTPIQQTISVMRQLKENRYRIYVLSNTNTLHKDRLVKIYFGNRRNMDFAHLLDEPEKDYIASYEVGAMKPDERIYRAALQRAGIPAQEAVFIDDNLAYVEAAQELGFRGIHMKLDPATKEPAINLETAIRTVLTNSARTKLIVSYLQQALALIDAPEPEIILYGSYADERQENTYNDLDIGFTPSVEPYSDRLGEFFAVVKKHLTEHGILTEINDGLPVTSTLSLEQIILNRRQGKFFTPQRYVWLITGNSAKRIDLDEATASADATGCLQRRLKRANPELLQQKKALIRQVREYTKDDSLLLVGRQTLERTIDIIKDVKKKYDIMVPLNTNTARIKTEEEAVLKSWRSFKYRLSGIKITSENDENLLEEFKHLRKALVEVCGQQESEITREYYQIRDMAIGAAVRQKDTAVEAVAPVNTTSTEVIISHRHQQMLVRHPDSLMPPHPNLLRFAQDKLLPKKDWGEGIGVRKPRLSLSGTWQSRFAFAATIAATALTGIAALAAQRYIALKALPGVTAEQLAPLLLRFSHSYENGRFLVGGVWLNSKEAIAHYVDKLTSGGWENLQQFGVWDRIQSELTGVAMPITQINSQFWHNAYSIAFYYALPVLALFIIGSISYELYRNMPFRYRFDPAREPYEYAQAPPKETVVYSIPPRKKAMLEHLLDARSELRFRLMRAPLAETAVIFEQLEDIHERIIRLNLGGAAVDVDKMIIEDNILERNRFNPNTTQPFSKSNAVGEITNSNAAGAAGDTVTANAGGDISNSVVGDTEPPPWLKPAHIPPFMLESLTIMKKAHHKIPNSNIDSFIADYKIPGDEEEKEEEKKVERIVFAENVNIDEPEQQWVGVDITELLTDEPFYLVVDLFGGREFYFHSKATLERWGEPIGLKPGEAQANRIIPISKDGMIEILRYIKKIGASAYPDLEDVLDAEAYITDEKLDPDRALEVVNFIVSFGYVGNVDDMAKDLKLARPGFLEGKVKAIDPNLEFIEEIGHGSTITACKVRTINGIVSVLYLIGGEYVTDFIELGRWNMALRANMLFKNKDNGYLPYPYLVYNGDKNEEGEFITADAILAEFIHGGDNMQSAKILHQAVQDGDISRGEAEESIGSMLRVFKEKGLKQEDPQPTSVRYCPNRAAQQVVLVDAANLLPSFSPEELERLESEEGWNAYVREVTEKILRPEPETLAQAAGNVSIAAASGKITEYKKRMARRKIGIARTKRFRAAHNAEIQKIKERLYDLERSGTPIAIGEENGIRIRGWQMAKVDDDSVMVFDPDNTTINFNNVSFVCSEEELEEILETRKILVIDDNEKRRENIILYLINQVGFLGDNIYPAGSIEEAQVYLKGGMDLVIDNISVYAKDLRDEFGLDISDIIEFPDPSEDIDTANKAINKWMKSQI